MIFELSKQKDRIHNMKELEMKQEEKCGTTRRFLAFEFYSSKLTLAKIRIF